MSYQERRAIVNLLSSVVITAIYTAVMIERYPQGDAYSPEVFRFWGAFFLILIGVTIVSRIVIIIAFVILNAVITRVEESDMMDERDQLIELKASRNALYVFSIGVVLAMGVLVLEQPPAAMFVILILAGVVSEMVSELSQFFYYRRGV